MKRRIAFKNDIHFVHMIAMQNMEKYDIPNAVASVFFYDTNSEMFKDMPSSVKHVVIYGDDSTEKKACDALTKKLEEYVGEPVMFSRDY